MQLRASEHVQEDPERPRGTVLNKPVRRARHHAAAPRVYAGQPEDRAAAARARRPLSPVRYLTIHC